MRQTLLVVMGACSGIAGNIIAAYVVSDVFSNVFTPARIVGTLIGLLAALLVAAYLESSVISFWGWWWHRIWYLADTSNTIRKQAKSKGYARLDLIRRRRPLLGAEVLQAGHRRALVDVLLEVVRRRKESGGKVLVVGEPGSGKTTSLEHLALLLARGWRTRFLSSAPIPILARLNLFQDDKLEPFLVETIKRGTRGRAGPLIAKQFDSLVQKGRLLFLFDAMDEALGLEERRRRVIAEVAKFVSAPAYQSTVVIITSRTREEPGLPELAIYEVQDLSDESVREFIALYKRSDQEVSSIWSELEGHGLLERGALGRNPFWLRMLVESDSFSGDKAQLIDQAVDNLLRRSLENEFVDRLLQRELLERPMTRPWQPTREVPKPELQLEARRGLGWLAYRMSIEGGTTISLDDANKELDTWINKARNPAGWSASNLIWLGQDASILDYRMYRFVQFRHRLLQESLTAWALRNEPITKADWQQQVDLRVGDTTWWQTILLLNDAQSDSTGLIEVVAQHATGLRLVLGAVLVTSAKYVDPVVAERVRAQLLETLGAGVSDDHRRAFIALQGLSARAFAQTLETLLSQADESSEAFRQLCLLLPALDTRTRQSILEDISEELRARVIATMPPEIGVAVLLEIGLNYAVQFCELATPQESATVLGVMPGSSAAKIFGQLASLQTQAAILAVVTLSGPNRILTDISDERLGAILNAMHDIGDALVRPYNSAGADILRSMGLDRAIQVLSIMDTLRAGDLIRGLNWTEALNHLSAMESRRAAAILVTMGEGVAADFLIQMDPGRAALVLTAMGAAEVRKLVDTVSLEQTASLFRLMQPRYAGDILVKLAPARQAMVVPKLDLGTMSNLLGNLSQQEVAALLSVLNHQITLDLLNSLQPSSAVLLLAPMDDQKLVEVLHTLGTAKTTDLLNAMESRRAAAILVTMGEGVAADFLIQMDPGRAALVTRSVGSERLGRIVFSLARSQAKDNYLSADRLLEVIGPQRSASAVNTLGVESAVEVLHGLSLATVSAMLRFLNKLISSAYFDTVDSDTKVALRFGPNRVQLGQDLQDIQLAIKIENAANAIPIVQELIQDISAIRIARILGAVDPNKSAKILIGPRPAILARGILQWMNAASGVEILRSMTRSRARDLLQPVSGKRTMAMLETILDPNSEQEGREAAYTYIWDSMRADLG